MPESRAATAALPGSEPLSLDTYTKSSGHRLERWLAREALWHWSERVRCRKCGRVSVSSDGAVQVRADGRSVGYAGLMTCGDVWVCPVCNARIQAVRRLEVGVGLAAAFAQGGGAAFGAVTVRHQLGQPLADVMGGLTYGLSRVAQDRTVKRLRCELGYVGQLQALEVTVGAHGWHPHRHPLMVFSSRPNPSKLEELHKAQFRAFRAGVEKKDMESPWEDFSYLKSVSGPSEPLSDYFSKATYSAEGAGYEMTSTQGKRGRSGGRTPWQVLAGFVATGDADDLALWSEYEQAMRGKRALTWSRGLREALQVGSEASDEEIAATEVGDAADAGFAVASWEPIAARAELGAGLLAAVTPAGNWEAGRAYARRHGIEIREIE